MKATRVLLIFIAVLVLGVEPAASQDEADAAWSRGDIETATQLYAERLAADSTDELALHRMALILGWSGQYSESINLFDLLLANSPRNWEAAVDRARVYAWRGETETALAMLDDLLELNPAHVPALQARAQFQSWSGEYAAAISTYEQIGQVVPEDRSVPRERARVLSWASRLDAAMSIYDSLLNVDPFDREAMLGKARVHAWADELDSAVAIYRQLLADNESDVEALKGAARALSWSGNLVAGERYWSRVVSTDSTDIEGLVGLAANLRWQGRDAAALEVIQRAELIAPANRDVASERRWLRTAVAPRTTASVVYENDSDGNLVTSVTARGNWRPRSRLELGLMAYVRGLGIDGRNEASSRAYGMQIEGEAQIEPGWDLMMGLGLSSGDVDGATTEARVQGKITSPARNRLIGAVGYLHEPLDASALLVQNQVTIDLVSLDLRITPSGGWRIDMTGSYAAFNGSESNTRWAAYASGHNRLSHQFSVGASIRSFGFEKNLNDGYFDPDRYVLAEINLRWQTLLGRWSPSLELAPGMQQVGKGGTASGAGRARVAIGYRVLPGREFELSGGYSTTGTSVFGSGADNYRYRSVMFLSRWVM